jgi:hypothetical protein
LIKFDGSKGTKDISIRDKNQKALFFRFSSELSDARLVTGLMNRFTTNWDEM